MCIKIKISRWRKKSFSIFLILLLVADVCAVHPSPMFLHTAVLSVCLWGMVNRNAAAWAGSMEETFPVSWLHSAAAVDKGVDISRDGQALPPRSARSPRIPVAHPTCKTVEKWTALEAAVDIFGNGVKILQKFSQDNSKDFLQSFYFITGRIFFGHFFQSLFFITIRIFSVILFYFSKVMIFFSHFIL